MKIVTHGKDCPFSGGTCYRQDCTDEAICAGHDLRKAVAAAYFSLSPAAPPEFNSASAILNNALPLCS